MYTKKLRLVIVILLFGVLMLLLTSCGNSTVEKSDSKKETLKEETENPKEGIPILLYHHLLQDEENQDKDNSMILAVEMFEKHMKYLHENGYYTITIDELEKYLHSEKELPEKAVVIQFDDGHKTNYLYAYPVLKKYDFKATSFLITNRVSDKPVQFDPKTLQFLSWPEVDEMTDVFEFASHTNGLHNLSDNNNSMLVTEDEDVIIEDLKHSKELLETTYFAYPFGQYDENTIQYLEKVGYELAFTTKGEHVTKDDPLLELGRYVIQNTTTVEDLKEMIGD